MLWALVMAGGWGTRLWPLSDRKTPKPFLRLVPGRKTLLEETLARLRPLVPPARTWVIGNEEHLSALRKHSPGVPNRQILGEPASRNTAPTVAAGVSLIAKKDPDAVVVVLPADHWIGDRKKFVSTLRHAAALAKRRLSFSILGIVPTFASTSYGYLEAGKKISRGVYRLKQFVEKPDAARADRFVSKRHFFWHAGIFIAPATLVLDSIMKFKPELIRQMGNLKHYNGRIRPARRFRTLPSVSIDYAVLERLTNAVLVVAEFDWCDIGTFNALESLWLKDKSRNVAFGNYMALDSSRNLVYAADKLAFLFGVKDLIVVDTPHALLVADKKRAERMRAVTEMLAESERRKRRRR